MKKTVIFALLFVAVNLLAQNPKTVRIYKLWHIDEALAMADTLAVDTSRVNLFNEKVIEKYSISNLYNGNYGSPMLSEIYTYRPQKSDFIFENSYKPYLSDMDKVQFYDISFPYSNLTYFTAGKVGRKEEQIKFSFSNGTSKRISYGTRLDFINSIGQFANQAAQRFSGDIFGRYSGKHYSAYVFAAMNKHKNYENGGLKDPSMLLNPNIEVKTSDMPVRLNGYSALNKNIIYYHHGYSIGIERETKVNKDSIAKEYIPVTRFAHSIKYEGLGKRYFEPNYNHDFYKYNYADSLKSVNDTASLHSLTNVLSINLAEEFNKWLHFGMTGYVENEIQQFLITPDGVPTKLLKSNTKVGGVLYKELGSTIKYKFLGDIYLLGYKLGEFRLKGEAVGKFNIAKLPIELAAKASVKNEEPSFYLQEYYSAHFRWKNNFTKTYKVNLGGEINIPKWHTNLRLNVENISNPIYFQQDGMPTQSESNVQIVTLDARKDFHLGDFVLENSIVYQVSSNKDIVPLPMLALYHNFYYHAKWFKDLYPQIGLNLRTHSKYYAPTYIPAIAQFANQSSTKVGGYPLINVYAHFHLKQARFFVEYTNIGKLMLKEYGMIMPNYPINPPMLKLGLSWNFYN